MLGHNISEVSPFQTLRVIILQLISTLKYNVEYMILNDSKQSTVFYLQLQVKYHYQITKRI